MKTKFAGLFLFFGSLFFFVQQNTRATPAVTYAPIPTLPTSNTTTTPVYQFMELAYLWEFLKLNYNPTMEHDATWLSVGFRVKYGMAKNYASLRLLEDFFGVPVFLEGPHKEHMDYNSTTAFGQYNPAFIRALEKTFKTALKDAEYKALLKNVYQKHLKSMAVTYWDAYHFVNRDPVQLQAIQEQYLATLEQPKGTLKGSLQETFRAYADAPLSEKALLFYLVKEAEQEYYNTIEEEDYYSEEQEEEENVYEEDIEVDWYEKATAPSFWVRRSIDGTSEQLFNLLNLVITELDT